VHGSVSYGPPDALSWSVQSVVLDAPVAAVKVYERVPLNVDGGELAASVRLIAVVLWRSHGPSTPASVGSAFAVVTDVMLTLVDDAIVLDSWLPVDGAQ
jgi:hypothetical protein